MSRFSRASTFSSEEAAIVCKHTGHRTYPSKTNRQWALGPPVGSVVARGAGGKVMKPPGRLLHRRQDVRRSERDLVSVLIAEGSLSSDWLVKRVPGCALKPPMGSEPRTSDAADPVRPGAG